MRTVCHAQCRQCAIRMFNSLRFILCYCVFDAMDEFVFKVATFLQNVM